MRVRFPRATQLDSVLAHVFAAMIYCCADGLGVLITRFLSHTRVLCSSLDFMRTNDQVDQGGGVSPTDLTSALDAIGFSAECVATTTTEEPTLDENGVNAVWAIASALGERARCIRRGNSEGQRSDTRDHTLANRIRLYFEHLPRKKNHPFKAEGLVSEK